jgi:hypothetical protein
MKKIIALLLVMLLALGTMTGCSRVSPVHQFEDAAANLVEYFADFADMGNLFPASRDHSCVDGTFSASTGTDVSETGFSGTFQADGKNHLSLLKMNLPLALLGADTSVKADVSYASKDGITYIGFPGTTDYVLTQPGSFPVLSSNDTAKLSDALIDALKKAATKKNISTAKEKRTVAGVSDVETTRLTMALNAAQATALMDAVRTAAGNALLSHFLDAAVQTGPLSGMEVIFYTVDKRTVRTEVHMHGTNGISVRLTLTTEGTEATAEWIASLSRNESGKETILLTATGDRKDSETGTVWSFERLAPAESGKNSVLRLQLNTKLNPDSGAVQIDAALRTVKDGKDTETPIRLDGIVTDDKFRGTVSLSVEPEGSSAPIPLTVQLDMVFSNRVKIDWTVPDSGYQVTADDEANKTEKYQQFTADLFERYPWMLDVLNGTTHLKPIVSGNFMLSNSDSTEMYIFYDNNTGIHRTVLLYTQEGNTISATRADGSVISFTYDPDKTSQTVTIGGIVYDYSIADGNIMLKSDAAWSQILIYGETMMLVDNHFNYLITGNVLTTFSGLDTVPMDHKFTSDGQFYYIDGAPYSYSSLDAAG